ncbi:GAP1-N1 domain-containing protein [Hydrogenophaga palleronii]|uniref:GAP1-N1 domain-containing protein n=1 Tax=Hydrogenophaga palleronii TaxID=65655 RepID=UPI000A74A1C3|nr:effector-associated domain EAD1-containing protein [Hydrogenophaga palleronii]
MRVHKAWYGPKGGHALLSSTDPGMLQVFRQAAWLTDLPGTAPPGREWQPYFRTAIFQNYFVFVHTRASHDSTRAGMVDSVAAFIPLAQLPQIPDLRVLAENLRHSHDSQTHEPFEVTLDPEEQVGAPSPLLLTIANALISAQARPVVHIGQEGFDEAMLDLLQFVPKQFRREILFSLSFSPDDAGQSFAVATPREQASRFPPAQVLTPSKCGPSGRVAALLNMPEGQPLLEFGELAGFDLQSSNALVLLEQGFQLWTDETNVERTIALVRLLAVKSSDATSARKLRAAALQRLTSSADQWTPTDVLAMRNLQIERFDSSSLTQEFQAWVARRAASHASSTPEDCQLLVQAARAAAQQNWWNTHAQNGYSASSKSSPSSVSSLVWLTLQSQPEDIEPVLALAESCSLLAPLTQQVPSHLPSSVAKRLAEVCARRQAWALCGTALAAAYSPAHALSEVLKHATTRSARRVAVEPALAKATPAELITLAVDVDLEEVTALAASAVVSRPSLIREFDWTSHVWFDILQRVAGKRRAVAVELPGSLEGLQGVITRGDASERVWIPLVSTGLADLSKVPNRADAWALIPKSLHRDVLALTAKGWLASLLDGTASLAALEEPFGSAARLLLRDSNVLPTLAQKSPALFINIINGVHPLSDDDCVGVLDSLANIPGQRLAPVPAKALGALIRERSWRSAASRAASFGRLRDDFLAVCKECLEVMSFWDSFPLAVRIGKAVEIKADDAWKMLEESLVKLYPGGPTEQEVWSRSGGYNEDLSHHGNGVAQWHRCLKQVRAGNGTSSSSLLNTALKDFGSNPVLQVLRDSRALG